jgi:hypothetical protein
LVHASVHSGGSGGAAVRDGCVERASVPAALNPRHCHETPAKPHKTSQSPQNCETGFKLDVRDLQNPKHKTCTEKVKTFFGLQRHRLHGDRSQRHLQTHTSAPSNTKPNSETEQDSPHHDRRQNHRSPWCHRKFCRRQRRPSSTTKLSTTRRPVSLEIVSLLCYCSVA